MRQNYHKNSVTRKFQLGELVLSFLPVSGKFLQARYSGPYVVENKESELNYVIVTPDRRINVYPNGNVECDDYCPGYSSKKICKHTIAVSLKLKTVDQHLCWFVNSK